MIKLILTTLSFLYICFPIAGIASPNHTAYKLFKVQMLYDKLSITWGMDFISNDQIIFTQKKGKVGLFNIKNKQLKWLKNIPKVYYAGQGGFLDVAISPNYKQTGWIYFTYSQLVGDKNTTTLASAKLKGNTLHNWQQLLITSAHSDTYYHFGSRITFDQTGHVYFSIGDRGNRSSAQELSNHAGSILRLKLDGAIPDDNPFIGIDGKSGEIWSYGHRNPQGLFYDNDTNRLWSIEHGPRGGDEINLIEKGKNYGWPVISYGKEYWGPVAVGEGTHKKGMEQPVKTYIPSIAPSSLIVYSGKAFPQWKGNLFAGALKLKHINQVVINKQGKAEHEERLVEDLNERIRCVIEGPDGFIYFSTDSGKIMRIVPITEETI